MTDRHTSLISTIMTAIIYYGEREAVVHLVEKALHQGIQRFGTLDMAGLQDIVLDLISFIRREADVLKLVRPVKAQSDYSFAHSTNVTILSIFQAESLGLGEHMLHEVGVAALMHDIGKLFVPKSVIEKDSGLDPAEWELMKKHTIYGAKYLSLLPEVPRVAVIAAYEHHLKFNGTGYPDTRWRGKKQHLVSQIISISDFFDALRTERPYRKALDVPVIVGIMKEAAGRDFNPLLVDHFIGYIE